MNYDYELGYTDDEIKKGISRALYADHDSPNILAEGVEKGSLSLSSTGRYSSVGWNMIQLDVRIQVAPHFYTQIDRNVALQKLQIAVSRVISPSTGYVPYIEYYEDFMASLGDSVKDEEILLSMEQQVEDTSSRIIKDILPDDIQDKGIYMAEVYSYFYMIENSLREFIKLTFVKNQIEIKFNTRQQRTIDNRKLQEFSKNWMSFRGDEELYYLDFSDLSDVITNNWEIFKVFFDSQETIRTKLDELAALRNKVAHNSYLDQDEVSLIKVYYRYFLNSIERSW